MILGGGMTGLGAGMASGLPIYETEETPGGIGASYYVCPGHTWRLSCTAAGRRRVPFSDRSSGCPDTTRHGVSSSSHRGTSGRRGTTSSRPQSAQLTLRSYEAAAS